MFTDRPAIGNSVLAAVLAGAAVVLGGGGSPSPAPEIALQLLTFVLTAIWIARSAVPAPFVHAHREAWTIVALFLVLPLVQLIPLPPFVWQAMNGRELMQASLGLIGEADSWRPWSLFPARTIAALLVMIPAALMLLATASLPRGGRATVIAVVTTMAVIGVVIGAGQMTGGTGNALRFYVPDVDYLNGFQANHNSEADLLLIAMVGVAVTIREYAEFRGRTRLTPAYRIGVTAAATLLLAFAVFLTASRMGIALLPIGIAGVLWAVWPWLRMTRRTVLLGGALCAVLVAVAAMLATRNHVIDGVLSRFAFGGEYRPQIWRDTWYAITQYFPWGSGMGTFVPIYQAGEALEYVGTTVPNRAHNDVLELLLEGGVFGAMLLAAIGWTLLAAIRRAMRIPPSGSRGQVIFAVIALALIALHSQVDYPLRSMSLAFVAAICVGLLMPLPDGNKLDGGEPRGGNA